MFNTLLSSTFLFFISATRSPEFRAKYTLYTTHRVIFGSNTFTSATECDLMIIKLSTDRTDFPRLFTSVSDQKCDDVKKKSKIDTKTENSFPIKIHTYAQHTDVCILFVKMFRLNAWLCWFFVLRFMWRIIRRNTDMNASLIEGGALTSITFSSISILLWHHLSRSYGFFLD